MPVTTTGANSRAVRTGEVIITNDYMRATQANPGVIVGPDNSRHDDAGRAETVGVPRKGIPAKKFQKAVYLTLRVVEPTRAGPPVRAAVDRFVAVGIDDAAQLTCEQLGEVVPRHTDEFVGASQGGRAGAVAQPAAPNGRGGDAGSVADRAGQVAQQGRRVGVALEWCDRGDVTRFHARGECAPVRKAGRGGCHEPEFRTAPRCDVRVPTNHPVGWGRLGGNSPYQPRR